MVQVDFDAYDFGFTPVNGLITRGPGLACRTDAALRVSQTSLIANWLGSPPHNAPLPSY